MNLEFDEAALGSFVETFQRSAPLTIAELWALPAMLRLATLESLTCAVATFFPELESEGAGACRLDGAVCVERSIRVLRLLADIDWRAFFQQASVVDATLREDAAHVYTGMTFESRDAYRKVVEEIAWETEKTELDVARAAIDLAAAGPEDSRESHVGYYLVDRGLPELKRRVGYRANGKAWIREQMLARPTAVYLGSIAIVSAVLLSLVTSTLMLAMPLAWLVVIAALAVVPISSIAVAFTNFVVVRLLPPRVLPKLDLASGVPDDCRTLVVVPALVSRPSDVDNLLAQLELHYLSSAGPSISFAVLSDFVDSKTPPDTTEIFARADALVAALNAKHGSGTTAPFHFLHRESRYNAGEGCFMGWERKRGKLDELNKLLRGDTTTSYVHHAGDDAGLTRIRFVITLDADTQLPLGAVQKLVGLAGASAQRAALRRAHRRHRRRILAGAAARRDASRRDRALALRLDWIGPTTALDIYTHAVSDAYQDLFGAGAYVGKGLYDVDAFMKSTEGRVPENTLCSHRPVRGCARARCAGVRRVRARALSAARHRGDAAAASMDARRLADCSVALAARARRERLASESTEPHRSMLEDPRQSSAQRSRAGHALTRHRNARVGAAARAVRAGRRCSCRSSSCRPISSAFATARRWRAGASSWCSCRTMRGPRSMRSVARSCA